MEHWLARRQIGLTYSLGRKHTISMNWIDSFSHVPYSETGVEDHSQRGAADAGSKGLVTPADGVGYCGRCPGAAGGLVGV